MKALLKDMADEGLIDSAPGRAFHKMGGVPKVTVLRVAEVDDGGNAWAVPEQWHAESPAPKIRLIERGRGALGIGDRLLARTEERGAGVVGHVMKKLQRSAELVLGVVRQEGTRFWLTPVDKRERRELAISELSDAEAGDLVLTEVTGRPPRVTARVDAILGDPFAPRSFSLIAIHKFGLRHAFGEEAVAEASKAAALALGDREDLTHLPIVAIDPVDARDHDDAIWATPRDGDDGWDAIVAIADVSFYVRPGSALDVEARKRGNSVYFPDRVVPMLPEELSAGICSLKAGEPRAALACHLHVGTDGALKSWRFSRAKVLIAANIAYEQAQAAIDSTGEERIQVASPTCDMPTIDGAVPSALVEGALKPLWACWKAMFAARTRRAPLELDLPERAVVLDEKGRIASVAPRERLDAHRLVEDYMIAANVAAARALEAKRMPVMYRVHEAPSREKLVALKDYLKTFGVEFALGQVVTPALFNRIIDQVGDGEGRMEIMEQLLRTQMQARYAPERLGHFGLSLATYAHFTSPIRRYADLLVHRALVRAYKLGDGGLPTGEEDRFGDIGEQISGLERRAMEAERETIDRYVAAYLSDRVGQLVECRITGVQSFGFFAAVDGLGGDGILFARDIGREYFRYDEGARTLTGDDSGDVYRTGQRLTLRLAEANPVTGSLRFEMPEGSYGGAGPQRRDRTHNAPAKRGRPANIRHQSRRR
ncbi:MAG: VacB/RNase II family 3'-5' exoribonuclease [Sphingomicrobium sp.]